MRREPRSAVIAEPPAPEISSAVAIGRGFADDRKNHRGAGLRLGAELPRDVADLQGDGRAERDRDEDHRNDRHADDEPRDLQELADRPRAAEEHAERVEREREHVARRDQQDLRSRFTSASSGVPASAWPSSSCRVAAPSRGSAPSPEAGGLGHRPASFSSDMPIGPSVSP